MDGQTLLYATADSEISIQLMDFVGVPVPGVVNADLTCYYWYNGGGAALDNAHFDWSEVDAVLAPGLYRLAINAAGVAAGVLDNLGPWFLRIAPRAVAPIIAETIVRAHVMPRYDWDYFQRLLGLSQGNYVLTATAHDGHGFMTAGTIDIYRDNGLVDLIGSHNIVVNYDPMTRVLVDYTVTEA